MTAAYDQLPELGLHKDDVVYLGGPMTGYDQYNFPRFFEVEKEIVERYGCVVVNPARLDEAAGFDPNAQSEITPSQLKDLINRDLSAIVNDCTAMVVLDGWQNSTGCTAEVSVALWKKILIVHYESGELIHSLPNKSKSAPKIVVEEGGGKHSFTMERFDCIPPECLILLAQCLGFGATKYGDDNWKSIPLEKNLGHLVNHVQQWRVGNRDEPHLVNACARAIFSLYNVVSTGEQGLTYNHPEAEEVFGSVG